jgi:acyl carrier protein
MDVGDAVHKLLTEFFDLPKTTPLNELTQQAIAKWDSLAMVQLITELQLAFNVQFVLDEIEHLRSYAEISECLRRKGVVCNSAEHENSLELESG